MSQFEMHNAGNTEAQQKAGLAFLLAQSSVGKAATGVLTGLAVSQTTTASGSVVVAAGASVAQASTLDGASELVNDSAYTLDVLGANPMGGLPRNDIVVFDAATITVRVIVGTPSATPSDPTVPSSAVKLARIRNAASATTIPASAIDDLRVKTSLVGAANENFMVRGIGMAGASTSKAGKRMHWDTFTSLDVNRSDSTGIQAGIPHGAGFTPSVVVITPSTVGLQFRAFNLTATTFDIQVLNSDGSANGTTTFGYSAFFGE